MNTTLTPPSQRILLSSIRWETYRAIARDCEQQPRTRLTYDQGQLEIRMPSDLHETYKKLLGRIVEALTEACEIEIRSLGSMTCDRQDLARGLEPDQCYYIQNEAAIWGKETIDLQIDPPPDLAIEIAIEIDITSSSLNRFQIYARLGVPEIWRYDGQALTIFVLESLSSSSDSSKSLIGQDYRDRYLVSQSSMALPFVTTSDLQRFLNLKSTVKENALIRQVREWATR